MIAFENGFAKRRVLKDELLSVAPRWEKVYYWFRFIAVGLRGLANTNKPQKLCKKNKIYLFLSRFHRIIIASIIRKIKYKIIEFKLKNQGLISSRAQTYFFKW